MHMPRQVPLLKKYCLLLKQYLPLVGNIRNLRGKFIYMILRHTHFIKICRYNNEIKAGRKVGIKKGLLLGVSTGYLFFILFLSYAVAFW